MKHIGKVALLWRGDRAAREAATAETSRFDRVFEALAQAGVSAEPARSEERRVGKEC